ncbi:ABC transporter substrate-binding protein [Canibacter sp. lx-45]|nr:ABC transporter substrate-binding protein [Canibacter zhuwentaonis]
MVHIVKRSAKTAATILTASALLLMAGCANTAEQNSADTVQDGTVKWVITGANLDNGHMDPHRSQLDSSFMIGRLVLDSLTFLNNKGELKPWLAKSWEVSEDGKKVTFKLRDDVKFHDGEPFNAEAVKANFEHIVALETESAAAKDLLGGSSFKGVNVMSEYLAEVEFEQPFVPFLNNTSSSGLGMYSPKALRENADKLATGGPGISVGSGPWKMTELVAGSGVSYERNSDYKWYPEGVTGIADSAAKLELGFVADDSLLTVRVENNEAQIASQVKPLAAAQSKETVHAQDVPGLPYSVYLNTNRDGIKETKVRQALNYSVDKAAATKAVYGDLVAPADSVLTPATPFVDVKTKASFDVKKAEKLLDEAGWVRDTPDAVRKKDGKELKLSWVSWTPRSDETQAFADLVIDNWRKIGVAVTNEVVEPGEYLKRYTAGDMDLTDWSFMAVDPDALRNHLHSKGFQNASHISDPELDKKLEAAAAANTAAARTKLYSEIVKWANEEAVIIPLHQISYITINNKHVKGLEFDGYGRPLFFNVAEIA